MGSNIEQRIAPVRKESSIQEGPGMTDMEQWRTTADLYGADLMLQHTIGSLPDDVLLDVFDIYLTTYYQDEGESRK
jgi:hypothetical protein